jgi:hypothetical protein
LSRYADATLLLRSMLICAFGGDEWVAVHKALLPNFEELVKVPFPRGFFSLVTHAQPIQMRQTIGMLGMDGFMMLLDMLDDEGIDMMPTQVQRVLQTFTSEVSQHLKYEGSIFLRTTRPSPV